jgi:hypothetical protein
MRRYWVGTAIVGLLIPLSGGVAYAGVGNDGANGATIVRGATCSIRTNTTGDPKTPTTDMQAEITPSGQVNLVCHATAPQGTTIAPFNQSGFPCNDGPAGVTNDSHVVWTPSGHGTLTCHGKIPPPPA